MLLSPMTTSTPIRAWFRAVFLLPLAMLFVTGCGKQSVDAPEQQDGATYRNLGPDAEYVGIDACAECHIDQAHTYRQAQMGRSFKEATLTLSAARFDNVKPVYDPTKDFYYFPFNRGDSLYLKEFRLAGSDTVYSRTEKIDYIVGSGQHTNSHMMDVNGYVYQIPLTWYAQEGRWDLPPGFDDGHNWRFERAIEIECMTCHNAMPKYVDGSDNRYDFVPHGIDCERCHGPGSIHVQEKKAGIVVNTNKEIDYSIVNPRKLPRDLQFDICQRCHLQGVAVPRLGSTFEDFRPGMRLADVIDVYLPRYTDSLSHFIMASHPDRLRMSKCGIPSTEHPGQLDPLPCTSCHNPHIPVESLGRDHYNSACISCHNPPESIGCSETPEKRAALDDDCSTCHMPLVSSMDIPHVKITDHFIRVPDSARGIKETKKTFVRLASLTNSRPTDHEMGEGYLAYYEQFNNVEQFLDSAAVHLDRAQREDPSTDMVRALIRLWYLQKDYTRIKEFVDAGKVVGVREPWTYYRIGEAFSSLQLFDEAKNYYGKAVDLAPDHLWFRTKLAASQVALGHPEVAIAIFNDVLEDNPVFEDAYNNRGYAWVLLGDFPKAEADFRKALSLDPDARQALANLASVCLNTGRADEALSLVDRLIKLDPENQQYLAFRKAVLTAR